MLERQLYPTTEPIGDPSPLAVVIGDFPQTDEVYFLPFTRKQRLAILERDGNRCQATVPHQHDKKHPLEVDHVIPQRYAQIVGIPDVDIPENALTKCRNAHDLKHTDRIAAKDKYREGDKNAYDEMFAERHEKLNDGEIYWDPSYDRTDMVQALKRTQVAKAKGWVFPTKGKIH